jgi:hypothetical protein
MLELSPPLPVLLLLRVGGLEPTAVRLRLSSPISAVESVPPRRMVMLILLAITETKPSAPPPATAGGLQSICGIHV